MHEFNQMIARARRQPYHANETRIDAAMLLLCTVGKH